MKRAFLLLLAALLTISTLTACASNPTVPTDPPADATITEPADTATEEPVEEPVEEPADTAEKTDVETGDPAESVSMNIYGFENAIPQAAIDGVALPLVDEPTEISLFMQWTSEYVGSPMEIYSFQEISNRTGVEVDYQCVSSDEQYQIMYVSHDYADIIKGSMTGYKGGVDMAIEDEIYVDAAQYSAVTPIWNAWQEVAEGYEKFYVTDSGNKVFAQVQTSCEPSWCGGTVRGDWLEDCGLEAPVTYDDWYEMLVAFRDVKGATKPLAINSTGYDSLAYTLIAGYQVAPGYYQVDGVLHYGFAEDAMRDYLTMLNKWYGEGLIDPDFPGYMSAFVDGQKMYTEGTTGAWEWAPGALADLWPMLAGDDGYLLAVTNPVKQVGETTHLRQHGEISGNQALFITTAAVERGVDELCARWIDYSYTMEAAYIYTFGEEGVDWNYTAEGYPQYTEHYYMHPDTKTVYSSQKTSNGDSSVYLWWREYDSQSENVVKMFSTWFNGADASYTLPNAGLPLTAEESEDYSSRYSDIGTYVDENIPLFIRGDRSLDTWDQFVEALYDLGLQECIDIYQTALNRYNAR